MTRYQDYPPQEGRRDYVIINDAGHSHYLMIRDCPFCGQDSRIRIPAQGLYDWEHGAFAQVAFPTLNADEREQVMTGIHPKCWDDTMKEPEE